MNTVGPLEIGEVKALRFDFSSEIVGIAALTGSPTVTVTVLSGVDPSPSTVLVGSPSISGNEVLQLVRPGVAGCSYKLRAVCSDNSGLTHGISVKMDVVLG